MGVFHTLLAGKAGQLVPGIVVAEVACAPSAFGRIDVPPAGSETTNSNPATTTALALARRRIAHVVVRLFMVRVLRERTCIARQQCSRAKEQREAPSPSYDVVMTKGRREDNASDDSRLGRDFFARPSDIVAEEMLGTIMTVRGERTMAARVLEVEAYGGLDDPASHAFRGPTPRAAIMFGPAGYVYVYLIYGVHWCMNIVCEHEGTASAVLLRAAEVSTLESPDQSAALVRGPGNLTRALGVTGADNGLDCCESDDARITFRRGPLRRSEHTVRTSPRIGLSKGQERVSRYFLFPDITK